MKFVKQTDYKRFSSIPLGTVVKQGHMRTKPNIIKVREGVWMLDLRGKTFSSILQTVSEGKKTLYFDTKVGAETKAGEIEELLTSYGTKKLQTLEAVMRVDPIDLQQRLSPFNATVQEAVDFFIKMKSEELEKSKSQTVNVLVDEWLAEKKRKKEQNTMRGRTYDTLKIKGDAYKLKWGDRPVATITRKEIQEWIDNLEVVRKDYRTEASQITKRHYLNYLSQFFIWCKNNHGVPRDNPCNGYTVDINEDAGEVVYYTPEEAQQIMEHCMTKKFVGLIPYVAICLFSGVRVAECERLTWDNIDFEDKTIILTKADAKTFGRRPEMQPNLVAWLKWFNEKYPQYPLIPKKLVYIKRIFKKSLKLECGWLKNGLRHSAASYTLGGIKKDYSYLEANFGNSRQMLQQHYINFPSKDEALKFWSILPPK